MSDDLVTLKVLIASDAASERDALKSAASKASVVIDVAEVDRYFRRNLNLSSTDRW